MPRAAKSRILARLGASAAIAATLVTLAGCDSQKTGTTTEAAATARQVTVTGKGQVQGVPDTLTINAATSAVGADPTAAINQSSDKMNAVLGALKAKNVSSSDIATTNVTVSPQYGPDGNVVTGYQATNAIEVTVRDISTASNILALMTFNGGEALRITSVSYSINDDSQLVRDARVVLGSIASLPSSADDVARALIGERLSVASIAAAAAKARSAATPMDNTDQDPRWRGQVTPVHVERTLRAAAGLGALP